MDDYMIEQNYDDELQHWGIKGQKWGVRRYQNKDGSLKPAGQKRYNKEVEKLKKEKAKVKAEEKVLANKKKTQAKIDKLEAEKKALEERKKALKEEQSGKKSNGKGKKNAKPEESFEERREKALKTSDPNELYKNRDTLSDVELRDRINRINMERQLAQTAASTQKTGMDRVNEALKWANKADEVYKFATGSAMGKDLMKKLGIGDGNKSSEFDLDDFVKNIKKKSHAEIKDVSQRLKNENTIIDERNRRENKKKADEEHAKKQAEEAKKAKEEAKQAKKDAKNKSNDSKTERYEATGEDVMGEGKSRSSMKDESKTTREKPSDYYDPIDSYGEWVNNNPVSGVPAVVTNRGRSAVDDWMDKYR